MFQTLTVQPNGQWTFSSSRGDPQSGVTPRRGQLSAAQRGELARLAAAPGLAAEASAKPGPPKCTDGFQYTLTVGSLTVAWGDCGAVSPAAAMAIFKLLAEATPL